MSRLVRWMRWPTYRAAKTDRGQSMAELVVLTPLLLLLFLGVIDFSRLYHAYVAATNAARVGAEFAMPYSNTNYAALSDEEANQRIVDAVKREAAPNVPITNVVVTPTKSSRVMGTPVQVGVTYVFTPYTPIVANFWGGGPLPLVYTATARTY